MIKFSEIKPGDIFIAEFDGQKVRGTVKDVNREIKEVCIDNGVQEFWFTADHLHPVLRRSHGELAVGDVGAVRGVAGDRARDLFRVQPQTGYCSVK